MRIVIDGQGAQTASRFRGIGRYSLGFIEAVAKAASGHEVILALNGMLTESIIPIRRRLHGILPAENIKVWHSIGPTRESFEGTERNRALALAVRREFIESLNPDVVHVTSVFEGFFDDAVVEGNWTGGNFVHTATIYDFIPLLSREKFLEDPGYKKHYDRALSELTHFDGLMGISPESLIDAERFLEYPPALMRHIGIGLNRSEVGGVPEDLESLSFPGNRNDSILVVAGDDSHKNIDLVLTALAACGSKLRNMAKVVFVGKVSEATQSRLRKIAKGSAIPRKHLRFVGYVEDSELVELYRTSRVLVMPSRYEGFGLPVLEAMANGLPVAVSRRGALPGVVGRSDVTFNPDAPEELAALLERLYFDESFGKEVAQFGLARAKKFDWRKVADRALQAWQDLLHDRDTVAEAGDSRRKVALVSPLPPEQSGIADFTAELVPLFSTHWDITLIHPIKRASGRGTLNRVAVESPEWLLRNWRDFDFVLYMFGNSPHHNFSYELLRRIPGIVVLHDVFLSSFFHWRSTQPGMERDFERALVETHGLRALDTLSISRERAAEAWQSNWPVLKRATGVLVHSRHARTLLLAESHRRMPRVEVTQLPKAAASETNKEHARRKLGIPRDAFVVSSFGFIQDTKRSREIVVGFLESELAKSEHSLLYLVGACPNGVYGEELRDFLAAHDVDGRVRITGYVSLERYEHFMAATDMVVQLRTNSRGESSAALAGCLTKGLPALVNRHGSFSEFPENLVRFIPDKFSLDDLSEALNELFRNSELRDKLAKHSKAFANEAIVGPRAVACYVSAVEELHTNKKGSIFRPTLAGFCEPSYLPKESEQVASLARGLALTFPDRRARTLFIDITGSKDKDYVSGIERVVSELTKALLDSPPIGFTVEPVYLDSAGGTWVHRRATNFALKNGAEFEEPVVDISPGDVIVFADIASELRAATEAGLLDRYRQAGANLVGLVHDILPISHPMFFPPGMSEAYFGSWLDTFLGLDGVIGVSRATADAVAEEAMARSDRAVVNPRLWIESFSLGSLPSSTSQGANSSDQSPLNQVTTVVMLGTVEPRKGYPEILDAFEYLWGEGHDIALTIIGREGWRDVSEGQRRNIPSTVTRMVKLAEKEPRFTWLDDAGDATVDSQLRSASGLVMASYAEGYGLPIVEALVRGIPVLARDIAVFREFSGPGVSYFLSDTPETLGAEIVSWLDRESTNRSPVGRNNSVLSWHESAVLFQDALLRNLP